MKVKALQLTAAEMLIHFVNVVDRGGVFVLSVETAKMMAFAHCFASAPIALRFRALVEEWSFDSIVQEVNAWLASELTQPVVE